MSPHRKIACSIGGETEQVADYLRIKFIRLQTHSNELMDVPRSWSLEYLTEVDLAANVLYQAYQNPGTLFFSPHIGFLFLFNSVRTGWDGDRYSDAIIGRKCVGPDLEAKLKANFPPISSDCQLRISPGVILDKFGKVLLWYLPAILQPTRQAISFFFFLCLYGFPFFSRYNFLRALSPWRMC
jgi:hypothetical protein